MKDVMRMIGLSRTTIWGLEHDGKFPKRRNIGGYAVGSLGTKIHESIDSSSFALLGMNQRWNESDSEGYFQNGLENVPAGKIISTLETVARRTPAKINSFKYFVKEILAAPDPRNRAWQKKRLEKIVDRIRDNSVGRADTSALTSWKTQNAPAPAKELHLITTFSTN